MRNSLVIIDDSELDRAIFNEIFKKDYRVLRAATASEGIDLIRKNVLDIAVVVLDICLQRGPSGFSVLERIHKQEGCAQLPVVLLTAEAEPEWVYRGVELGAVDFLVKPLAPVATQNRIKAIIEDIWGSEAQQDADAPSGKISLQKAEILTQRWQKKFLSFCQNHDITFPSYTQRLRIITSALADAYYNLFPESGLTPYDCKLISMASGFAEVGQLALPDDIIWGGADQPEPGRTQFFLHTKLGGEFFRGGPQEWEPLITYCSEVAEYHHKNYDGTGYPPLCPGIAFHCPPNWCVRLCCAANWLTGMKRNMTSLRWSTGRWLFRLDIRCQLICSRRCTHPKKPWKTFSAPCIFSSGRKMCLIDNPGFRKLLSPVRRQWQNPIRAKAHCPPWIIFYAPVGLRRWIIDANHDSGRRIEPPSILGRA